MILDFNWFETLNFIVGFLSIIGLLRIKSKRVKILFVILLGCNISFITWYSVKSSQEEQELTLRYVGVYMIDLEKSKVNNSKIVVCRSLTLRLLPSGIFSFSQKCDFIPASKGTWTYELSGSVGEAKFHFENGIEQQINMNWERDIILCNPPTDVKGAVNNILYFTRIND